MYHVETPAAGQSETFSDQQKFGCGFTLRTDSMCSLKHWGLILRQPFGGCDCLYTLLCISRYQNVKPFWTLLQHEMMEVAAAMTLNYKHLHQNVSILDLLELRMMEVVVTTGAIRRAKLQSNRHHQQTNTQLFFTGRMPFLSPNRQGRK